MEPFARPGIGELYLRTLVKPAFRALMALQGVNDSRAVTGAELDAYVDLLKRADGGRAFLRIMRGFERTPEKTTLYRGVVASDRYPVQVVWGENDPALKLAEYGLAAQRLAGVDTIHRTPGKHFLQEDCAPQIAERVLAVAGA